MLEITREYILKLLDRVKNDITTTEKTDSKAIVKLQSSLITYLANQGKMI